MKRMLALALIVMSHGCGGGDGNDDDSTPTIDADPFAPDADPLAPDARPPGAPDAAPPAALPACWETCGSPSDCGNPASPLTDANNYACDDGKCRYTGCSSTAECTEAFMSAGYVCDTLPGLPMPACYSTCSTAADCGNPASPLLDANNYDCEDGKCRWTGCNSTAECTEAFSNANYVCHEGACWPTCSTAADCNTSAPLFDGDNYACTDGRCQWTGCNSTSECTGAYMSNDWICE